MNILKSFVSSFIYPLQVLLLKQSSFESNIFIIGYHRVIEKQPNCKQHGLVVDPDIFRMHIKFLKHHFLPINSLDLLDLLSKRKTCHQPQCLVTFDDGWQDVYQNAFPILKEFSVPAIVYLPTNFINTTRWFWTDLLEEMLNSSLSHRIQFGGSPHFSKESGFTFEQSIEYMKHLSVFDRDNVLNELARNSDFKISSLGRRFLNWEEINIMKKSGIIEFGSHTANHNILTNLSKKEIDEELLTSYEELISRKIADANAISFSYPNGNFNKAISDQVRRANYKYAVTTARGYNSGNENWFQLKRALLHGDIAGNKHLLLSRMGGLF